MATDSAHTIGRFEVIRPLGRGSQGAVYLARDPTLDRRVAVKLLAAQNEELSEQAANGAPLEAVIASKLNHPNIVPIFDAGEDTDGQFLIFEYVEGETLASMLKRNGAFSIADAVPLFRAILDGMATAHEAGILHLDLSPRNILINSDGVPRIMDFGLAQFANTERANAEYATGTLRYMSPEHFLGQALGTATDVFALGSTFFELVTAGHAMRGSAMDEIRDRIIAVDVDFDPVVALEHGAAFARFLAGAMLPNPQGRYADCASMREAFELFMEAAGLVDSREDGSSRHSTIDFLLRRMQRKKDFPAISSTLADINRLTEADADTSAEKLANVILRDLSLTSKLLKLVNSAYYGVRAAEVTSISQAVVFLGADQVRMTANSLTLFGHLKGNSSTLKDAVVRSFLSGLIARHLARKLKLAGVEEAFIGGLCRNLGEHLVVYYFADEHEEIEALREAERLDKSAASRGVLGVSYADLGSAVAKSWGLPPSIVSVIQGLPPGPVRPAFGDDERMRDICVFANELCDLFHGQPVDGIRPRLLSLLDNYTPSIDLGEDYTVKLLAAGYEKLRAFAPVFEVNVSRSGYFGAVGTWLAAHAGADDEVRQSA